MLKNKVEVSLIQRKKGQNRDFEQCWLHGENEAVTFENEILCCRGLLFFQIFTEEILADLNELESESDIFL